MGMMRWVIMGGIGYAVLKAAGRPSTKRTGRQTFDGLSAEFATRAQADLAIEHLVQEHGVERATIFVEPIASENTSGVAISGGDASSGRPVSDGRSDAPLHGGLKLSVATTSGNRAILQGALEGAGATSIEAF